MDKNTNLNDLIKRVAINAVEAKNPVKVQYGTVVSESPLSIKLSDNLILPSNFFILTKSVCKYNTKLIYNGISSNYVIDNSLKSGDKVVLLKVQGGQEYIVLDKVGD